MDNESTVRQVRKINFKVYVSICIFTAIFPFILFAICKTFYDDIDSQIYLASIWLAAMLIFYIWSWGKITQSYFDPYIIFLIVVFLFHGGQAFLETFHYNHNGILDGVFSSNTILNTLWLVIIGISIFHFGALISASNQRNRLVGNKQYATSTASYAKDLRIVGYTLLFVSLVPSFLVISGVIDLVMTSGYSAVFVQESSYGIDSALQLLAAFLMPASLFLLAGSKYRSAGLLISLVTISSYVVSQLFIGSRLYATMPLIAYVWVWHRCIKRLPGTIIFGGGCILLFVVFPLIRFTRGIAGGERLSFQFLSNTFFSIDNPVTAIMYEMGTSLNTVAYTLDLVPEMRDFDMGISYLYAISTVMPNLFWAVHPAIAHGTYGEWLIWTVNQYIAFRGGGIGFSFIAEAYINFGWYGAPVILGIMGYLFGRFTLWGNKSNNPAGIATLASFLAFILFFARGESISSFRPIVWYSLAPFLLFKIIRSYRSDP